MSVTTTQNRAESLDRLVLVLQDEQAQTYVDRLTEIFSRYSEQRDPLSNQLFEWGVILLGQGDGFGMNLREYAEHINDRLVDLEKLLENPMNPRAILVSPVLDRHLVWEETELLQFLRVSPISPYDNEPIVMTIHDFAREMIAWLNEVRGVNPTQRQMEVATVGESVADVQAFPIYYQRAQMLARA